MSLLHELINEHGSDLTNALTSQLGLSGGQASDAIETIAPMVINGLKSQQDAGGTEAVSGIFSALGGSEDLLGNIGNLSGLLGNNNNAGANILSSLLGGQSQGGIASNAIEQKLGIDSGKASMILSTLVPIIMGFLSKKGRIDPNTPDTQSGIASILDRDGDGSALDDIASMVLQGGNRNGGGGMLGSIVSGLLGGR